MITSVKMTTKMIASRFASTQKALTLANVAMASLFRRMGEVASVSKKRGANKMSSQCTCTLYA